MEYLGARTTIQRILVDPVVNVAGVDRGLGLTFSHDHYGPSTFQQIGLYSTILAEPAGSTWVHNESWRGTAANTDAHDGGPTTWQAAILPPAPDSATSVRDVEDHREFYFEMSDFQHAYDAGTYVARARWTSAPLNRQPDQAVHGYVSRVSSTPRRPRDTINGTWREAVNPPLKLEAHEFPDVVTAEGGCPGPGSGHPTNNDPNVPRPCAEAINIGHSLDVGDQLPQRAGWLARVRSQQDGSGRQDGAQAAGRAGDLALAFSSSIERAIPELNTSFGNTPAGRQDAARTAPAAQWRRDQLRPRSGRPVHADHARLRGDQVKVKIQVGATEEQHQTTFHGLKWLSNGSGFGRSPNSGWRNFQSHGISEQFSLQVPINPDCARLGNTADYLYAQDATRDGIWLGTWGMLRNYGTSVAIFDQLPEQCR